MAGWFDSSKSVKGKRKSDSIRNGGNMEIGTNRSLWIIVSSRLLFFLFPSSPLRSVYFFVLVVYFLFFPFLLPPIFFLFLP